MSCVLLQRTLPGLTGRLGPRRHWECSCCWHDRRSEAHASTIQQLCLALLSRVYLIRAPRHHLFKKDLAAGPAGSGDDGLGNIYHSVSQPQYVLSVQLIMMTSRISTAKSWGVIAAMRVLIGCCEAFLQAGPLYLTFWYKRDQLAKRGSIFFSVVAIAGSMNGVIAYGIEVNLNGARGWPAWRWIFFIEGIICLLCPCGDTTTKPLVRY